MLMANFSRFIEAAAARHMEFVARPRECRQNGFGTGIWRCAALAREFWEMSIKLISDDHKRLESSSLTIVGKHFDFAKAQTSLDTDELNGHKLSDEWARAGECFCCAFVKLSRIPSAERIPLKISAAVTDADFEVLQRALTTTSASRDSHHSDCLWRQQINTPPRWSFFLRLRTFLSIRDLVSWFSIVRIVCWARSRCRWLIDWLSVRYVGA